MNVFGYTKNVSVDFAFVKKAFYSKPRDQSIVPHAMNVDASMGVPLSDRNVFNVLY